MQHNEPIAIVGMGCRFPGGANTPSKLWELLKDPPDLRTEILPESARFNGAAFYHPDNLHHGTSNVRHSYLLTEDHRRFDAAFFGIKPVEASSIDPQQRLLLETVYEALEAAGIPMEQLHGTPTAVFVGLMCADYADILGHDVESFPTYFATGTARSLISNRISYFFNWTGPSMTIDTACSSSLVAVHQAVQVLRSKESRVAIAAGANLLLGPAPYIAESKLQMLSPDGRSYMWDERANGYARGEGIACVVLKTLSAALEDGDRIEGIIRETAVNQDGRTKGITMPSAVAQAELIQSTYRKAGLDLAIARDRPQFFEAHGTGTPAGDPQEAEAIHTALFGNNLVASTPLYVGSIKTVIGHTEGTAGLAGVIKAVMALQHAMIPPNLWFDHLNPAVKPFYGNLQILTSAAAWPTVEPGAPRRASVNSFGFGGANAHCILESAVFPTRNNRGSMVPHSLSAYRMFPLSGSSEKALVVIAESLSAFIAERPALDLAALSYTLTTRRSCLPMRVNLAAASLDELQAKLDEFTQDQTQTVTVNTSTLKTPGAIRVLGIFTGQGAQWPGMAAAVTKYPAVQQILRALDRSLKELPKQDRPAWSLEQELLAETASSRINQAAFSQPLCTAVQIVLVDILRAAGIEFVAVVGHSSGEIGAAYAAGCLSARDAIRVAYYRGLHLHLAAGKDGQAGAMIAVGTSYEDAQVFCNTKRLRGRICVAASNAATSVTLSGDADAVERAQVVFKEEEKRFARILKVDRAYHSHHMLPCSAPYLASLQRCKISAQKPTRCRWISSVHTQDVAAILSSLADQYWVDNLVSPVLFSQALQAVLEMEQFDLVIEVGSHPALKGPASQVISEVSGTIIPYTGLLKRGTDDTEALTTALGYIWTSLGNQAFSLANYNQMMNGTHQSPQTIHGLPSYPWDHDRIYWHESRIAKAFNQRDLPPHVLLGTACPNSSNEQMRWNNYLHPRELPWIPGHRIQGQIVFPAAGYMSAASEAARRASDNENIQTIELRDFVIGQPLVFDSETAAVETMVSLTEISRVGSLLTAKFTFLSATGGDSSHLTTNASGALELIYGDPAPHSSFPATATDQLYAMTPIDPKYFYDTFSSYGYGYTGPFKTLSGMNRKLGVGTAYVHVPDSNATENLLIHPATLDTAIQSILLAHSYPGDGRLSAIQLPTTVARITINPTLCLANSTAGTTMKAIAIIASDDGAKVDGDVDIYPVDGEHPLLQLEGLRTRPMVPHSEATDVHIYSHPVWESALPDALSLPGNADIDYEIGYVLERVAYFYLRQIQDRVTRADRETCEEHFNHLLSYTDTMLSRASSGLSSLIQGGWVSDTQVDIDEILKRYPESIDLRLMRAVGENVVAAIRGETTLLEHMLHENMLNEFYVRGHGMPEYLDQIAATAKQIGHRYPMMNVLEIGAGTGGATRSILKAMGSAFGSYTYTDISSGFFDQAKTLFTSHGAKMIFKVLDIEKDIATQGFHEQSYDLVIGSLVLHATAVLEETLQNVRRLLKPGGYLLLLEITDNNPLRFGFIFGGLPGWWRGVDDGRTLSPCIELSEWAALLQNNGFSGVDHVKSEDSRGLFPFSALVSQAVDDRVLLLRDPLSVSGQGVGLGHLTVIGGSSAATRDCGRKIESLLQKYAKTVTRISSLTALSEMELPLGGNLILLEEYDAPIFQSITERVLRGVQAVFERCKNVIWVTIGQRECASPYSRMSLGALRCVVKEMRHLRVQSLDLNMADSLDASRIAAALIRLVAAGGWDELGTLRELLWSIEGELAYDGSRELILRARMSDGLNARYNSARRRITASILPGDETVELIADGGKLVLRPMSSLVPYLEKRAQDMVLFQTLCSTLRAVKMRNIGYLYLLVGDLVSSGERVFALSTSLSSRFELSRSSVFPCPKDKEQASGDLAAMFYQILAQEMLVDLTPGSRVLVMDPSLSVAHAVMSAGSRHRIEVTILLSQEADGFDKLATVRIYPTASNRQMRSLLPLGVSRLVACSDARWIRRVRQCLSGNIPFQTLDNLTSVHASLNDTESGVALADILHECVQQGSTMQLPELENTRTFLSLHLLEAKWDDAGAESFIDWNEQLPVPIDVQPVDSKPLFRADRTYWLVGLTGALGLSLCRWMVECGARYIAISSRNPQVDARWIDELAEEGATLKIVSSDVTDRKSLAAANREIRRALPPLAGVCHGAMVLHDTLFQSLDLERTHKVIRPKVLGAQHLDEIFHDTPLDWFVFLSSMACITGSPGQSAYAAANMFLVGLAAERRRRGVAASTVHIGAILGTGYIARELTLAQQILLKKGGNNWMAEQDFHQIFAEAVVASPPGSEVNPEYFTGLRRFYIDANDDDKPDTAGNPFFSHMALHRDATALVGGSPVATASVRARLVQATSAEDVYDVLKDAIVQKLQTTLQLSTDTNIINQGADALGIDSLIAVDLRSWFLKELNVDMPVLKIISGATMGQLLEHAQGLLALDLAPNLSNGNRPAVLETTHESIEHAAPDPPVDASIPTVSMPVVKDADPMLLITTDEVPQVMDDEKLPLEQEFPPTPNSLSSPEPGCISPNPSVSSESSILIVSPVIKETIERTLPMSFAQSRFWFLTFLLENKTCFNVTTSIELTGRLDVEQLGRAVEVLGQQHESLRTRFYLNDNHEPLQHVMANAVVHLEQRNISSKDTVSAEFASLKNHVYDLARGETLRIILLTLSEDTHYILLGYHHINMDGISFEIFFANLEAAYTNALDSESLIPQYPDYALTQRQQYADGQWAQALQFWQKELTPSPPIFPLLTLSTLSTRPSLTRYASHIASYRISPTLSARINTTCTKLKVHPFQFYLAIYRILLSRFSTTETFCIGVADAGRTPSTKSHGLGCYLNLLPISFTTRHTTTFSEIVRDTKSKAQAAFANSHVPIDVLLNELQVPRSSTASPLFQVFFNYRQGIAEARRFCGCESHWLEFGGGETAYDLSFDVVDNAGGNALLRLFVQDTLYTQADAEVLVTAFVNLVTAFAQNPAMKATRPPLFTGADVEAAVALGRGGFCAGGWDGSVSDRIEEMVRLYPGQQALKDGHGAQLTYGEMHSRVSSIALRMVDLGVGKGCRIGVFQDRSVDWVCSMLAIFRLGGVYIPLDPEIASKRLPAILDDCQPSLILVETATQGALSAIHPPIQTLNVSLLQTTINRSAIPQFSNVDAPIAILYTSGSTGTPKGIEISHASVKSHIEGFTDKWLPMVHPLHVLQQSSFSFDMSLDQVLWPLCSGGSVYIVPQASRNDPTAISRLILSERITLTAATPSQYISWINSDVLPSLQDSPWQLGISGGEPFTDAVARAFAQLNKSDLVLLDCYGPTEVTCFSHFCEFNLAQLQSWTHHPGFWPRSNIATYIVDENHTPQLVGMPGEIAIGGMGVAAGYINQAELNQQRFINDRHAPSSFADKGWTRMHLTGDKGRLRADRTLKIEGRIQGDTQVKLRGLRCDLRDIEAVLVSVSRGEIVQCVVSVRKLGVSGDEVLVAHAEVMSKRGPSECDTFFRGLLGELPLPRYMHPAMLIAVDELPRTASGKVDRLAVSLAALPQKQVDIPDSGDAHSQGTTEQQLFELWKQVLGKEATGHFEINATSDFFHVGGTSLLLAKLQPLMRQTFDLEIPVVQLFDASTLGKMAQLIDANLRITHPPDESAAMATTSPPVDENDKRENTTLQIDWTTEVAVAPSLRILPTLGSSAPCVVILTGATGFLGRALLQRLVNAPLIKLVHCIASRDSKRYNDPIFSHSKVQIHQGNLALPELGLHPHTAASILSEADTIIHNGADVSFLKSYFSLRQTNLDSTKQLACWAVQHGLRFHYVSTGAVTYLSGQQSYPATSVRDFPPPTDGSNGYIASKWASEVHLEQMHTEYSMPVVIHRPSSITGPGAPATDMMSSVLKYAKMLRALPRLDLVTGFYDFISVERAADQIVKVVVAPARHAGVQYVYESGEVQVRSDRIQAVLEAEAREAFTVLEMEEWVKRAEVLGMESMVGHLLKGSSGREFLMTRLIKDIA
ncbi:putative hybrid NRPS/PKS enzyme [Aspergillus karnatakaensis]|uniref:putative hybrid NRPS/PKS enzyme n=1 Tax=Aspergillus karnatakaensis TaxID=1810916 RepID=UPI003CCCEF83